MPPLSLAQTIAAAMIAIESSALLYLCRRLSFEGGLSRRVLSSLSLILTAVAIGRVSELHFWRIDIHWVAAIADLTVGIVILWQMASLWTDRRRLAQSVKMLQGRNPAAIADAVSRYQSLFDSAGLGIALRDTSSGAVIECNPRYLEIVGRRQQSLLGGELWTKPEFAQTEAQYRRRLIDGEIKNYELTKQIILPDGSLRWVRVWSALANAGSKTMDVLADVDREIRAGLERDQSLAQLEALNRELEGFAYACAHDLKSPLRRMRQRLQIALGLEGDALLAKIRETISIADHLTDFIEQLLEYSRLNRDEDLTLMPGSITEIAQAVAYQFEDEARFEIDSDLPRIRCSPPQIERLFANLYGNAVKHAGVGVLITVTGRVKGAFAEIDVIDNGPGVSKGLSHNLFQPFVRGEESTGVGMGLAICQKIVAAHGGMITLIPSKGGAHFRMHLPLV